MLERHLYQIRSLTGEALCEAWGCGAPAAWRAVYVFQRDGDPQATRRAWPYCLRHAQGWARAHDIDVLVGEVSAVVRGKVSEPVLESPQQGRRLLGAGRLWGTRQRARFLRG